MPGEGVGTCPCVGIPQSHRPVPTPGCNCFSIGTERYAIDPTLMPGQQGNPLIGRRIIQPNTDATPYRQTSAIRRIRNTTSIAPFTEPRCGPFG